MSFKSVWGFDPDEVTGAQLGPLGPNDDKSAYDYADHRFPIVPLDVDAQIIELRRMFGL
jgi:hypothetical protein